MISGHSGNGQGQEDFRTLAESSSDLIARFDRDLRHLYVNPAVEAATGVPRSEFVGKTNRDLGMPEDRVRLWEQALGQAFESGNETIIGFSFPSPDGERFFESRIVPEPGPGGPVATVLGITREITSRKRAEEASQQSEAILRGFFNAGSIGMAVVELQPDDFVYLVVNNWAAGFFNRPVEEVNGKGARELGLPEQTRLQWLDLFQECHASQSPISLEYSVPREGGERYYYATVSPVPAARRGLPQFSVAVVDISDRRRSEEALRDSEERYRTLFESIDEGFCVIEMLFGEKGAPVDYRFLEANPAFERHTGLQHALGKTARELVPDLDESWFKIYGEVALTGEPVRFENHAPSMDGRWFDVYAFPIGEPERRHVALLFVEISDRMQAQAALRESEERFRFMVNSLPLIVWLHDAEGNQEFVNQTFCEFFGVTEAEMRRGQWQVLMHPDDAESYTNEFLACVRDRRPFHAEVRVRRADGEWRWIESWGSPRFSATGAFLGFVGTSADITARKQAEKALREADRRKDEFLAVLAHELRNPLAAISGAVELGSELNLPDPEVKEVCQIINNQTQHMRRLLDDLLDVARITQGRLTLRSEPVAVEQVMEQAVEMARPFIDERHHQLIVTFAPASLQVHGDLTRLAQVLANLLNNAARYTPEGGRITLASEATEDEAVLRVRDNGIGLAADAIDTLFDPLVKPISPEGEGSRQGGLGLGLALVRNLVHLHGGSVEVTSGGPGQGSEFIVRLPRLWDSEAKPVASPSAEQSPRTEGSMMRVLLVEDNADLAKLTARLLTKQGFDVRRADDGPSALDVAREFQPQAIVLDLGLPGMSGLEVAQELRRVPETQAARIIAVSGYGQPHDIQESREAGCDDHLVKPVDLQTLIQSISAAES